MKSIRLLSTASVVALALGLAACGSDDDAGGSTAGTASPQAKAPAGLAKGGELSTCMDISFPPMESFPANSKQPVGFDVDVVKAVADAWGLTPRYSNTSFDGLLPALAGGRCDIVDSAMFVTPDRTKTFPAIEYFKTRSVILVKGGNPEDIASEDDLAGKTIATQSGTKFPARLKALSRRLEADGKPPITVQAYPKASDAIQQLVVGRADGVLTQDTEAAFRAQQSPGQFDTALTFPQFQTFGIYYTKDHAELGAALRKLLRQLEADGTLARIAKENHLPANGIAIG